MPNIQVKLRRGTAAEHDTTNGGFTGAEGEVTVDTTNDTLRVHDGSTAGGERLAKYSELASAGSGTVTSVDSGTGLTGGPITTSGTLSIANDGVGTAQIADNAVTAAKISSTDTTFNVGTNVGIGAVASGTYKLEVLGDIAAAGAGNKKVISHSTNSLGYLELFSGGQPTNQKTGRIVPFTGKLQLAWVNDNLSSGVVVQLDQATGSWQANSNGAQDLGASSTRWRDVWSSRGAFNGSDRNLKQDIEDLSEAEKKVAVKAKGLLKKYRLKDSVERKGDDARIHVGIIAQELQEAFESEGLDAFRYSMLGKDTWWEKINDEGKREVKEEATEGYTEVTQMSIRYSELLAFIIAAM